MLIKNYKVKIAIIAAVFIACLFSAQTRHLLISQSMAQNSDTEDQNAVIAALKAQIAKLQVEVQLTGAALCDECTSPDPDKSNRCLQHLSNHLQLMNQGTYCSAAPLTPADAKVQMATWCQKVGSNYPYPMPLWKTMYAALSEKYACQ